MSPFFCLVAAAVLTAALARRLCGDAYGAFAAGLVFSLAPLPRTVLELDSAMAAGVLGLPAFLLVFYISSSVPEDRGLPELRVRSALSVGLALLATADPRFGIAWGLLVWMLMGAGYAMDKRRSQEVWGPAFRRWALSCVGGIILYAPLWWWRLRRPLQAPMFSNFGPDADLLFRPSLAYMGSLTAALAASGLTLSRSYMGPARLWGGVCGLLAWLSLGIQPSVLHRTAWWAPSLYRLFQRLPWLDVIAPPFYGVAAQLGFAVLAAFGVAALLSRLPLRGQRWTRPLAGTALLAALAADFILR